MWRSSSSTLVPQTTKLLTLPLWEKADTLQKKLILTYCWHCKPRPLYRCTGTRNAQAGHTEASLPHVMLGECWSSSQLVVKSPLWYSSLWSSPSWWRRQRWLTEQPQPQPPHTVCYFNSASMESIKWKNSPNWTIFSQKFLLLLQAGVPKSFVFLKTTNESQNTK